MNIKAQSDFILQLRVNERSLAEGKNPPLCDGCSSPIPRVKDVDGKDTENFLVKVLILDDSIRGVECDPCVAEYFSKMPILGREDVPASVSQIVLSELAQEIQVVFLDEEIRP